jgi:peptide/nickel transport system ATP-binding protein
VTVAPRTTNAVVTIRDLSVTFHAHGQDLYAVKGVSFDIARGETYGLVGETGCGKSTIALALVQTLVDSCTVRGSVEVAGEELLGAPRERLNWVRRDVVAMVYQNPGQALNPSMRVGRQIAEAYVVRGESWARGSEQARTMLRRVQIADPELVMQRYPHQLSGGMQQRAVIAMALAKNPQLLILDEPTTGLDATVAAEVLDIIDSLKHQLGTSIFFISHNLRVIERICDRVGVMYAGRMVEEGAVDVILRRPQHPYTASLLGCIPRAGMHKDYGPLRSIRGSLPLPSEPASGCVFAERCPVAEKRCSESEPALTTSNGHGFRCYYPDRVTTILEAAQRAGGTRREVCSSDVILTARNLSKTFSQGGQDVRVLTDISIELNRGETLGIVGESGSGKTTLARVLLGLIPPDPGGVVELQGKPLRPRIQNRSLDEIWRLQIVFQDPDSALNRRHSVRRILARALRSLGRMTKPERDRHIADLVRNVNLPQHAVTAKSRSLSGGMKQRVAIARAFAGRPPIVVCDEPTSALDVSVQAAILNLFARLQKDGGTAYIFISHDLPVVRYLADRVIVMYLGRVMESAGSEELFAPPWHPYTEALLSTAMSGLDGGTGKRIRLGEPPSVANQPSGCVFNTRCPRKIGAICEQKDPPPQVLESGRTIKCHIHASDLIRIQHVAFGASPARSPNQNGCVVSKRGTYAKTAH